MSGRRGMGTGRRVMAGIGNLWANEISFLRAVSPWTRVGDTDVEALVDLAASGRSGSARIRRRPSSRRQSSRSGSGREVAELDGFRSRPDRLDPLPPRRIQPNVRVLLRTDEGAIGGVRPPASRRRARAYLAGARGRLVEQGGRDGAAPLDSRNGPGHDRRHPTGRAALGVGPGRPPVQALRHDHPRRQGGEWRPGAPAHLVVPALPARAHPDQGLMARKTNAASSTR